MLVHHHEMRSVMAALQLPGQSFALTEPRGPTAVLRKMDSKATEGKEVGKEKKKGNWWEEKEHESPCSVCVWPPCRPGSAEEPVYSLRRLTQLIWAN